jgi:hypothetical protein
MPHDTAWRRLNRIAWLSLGAVLATGFIFAAVWADLHEPPQKRHAQQPCPEQPQAGSSTTTARIEQRQTSENCGASTDAQQQAFEIAHKWIATFIEFRIGDFFLIIFTGVLAIKTSGLFAETAALRKGADDQRVDFLRSIVAAEKSACASREQAAVARQAFEVAQRPYVFVYGVTKFKSLEGAYEQVFALIEHTVANYGQTPAIIEEARIGFLRDRRPDPGSPNVVSKNHRLFVEPIIHPNERRGPLQEFMERRYYDDTDDTLPSDKISYKTPVDEDQISWIAPIMAENENLFFRVVIRYRGLFTNGHETSACWRFDKSQYLFLSAGPETNYEK